MVQKIAVVYKIVNSLNGKLYVGASASGAEVRWQQHRQNLRTQIHHSDHLQKAWNKYGGENFKFKILEVVENSTPKLLQEKEQYWMDFYDAANPLKGYNICPKAGTTLGRKQSEEAKAKISKANMGHPVSERTREITRQKNKGNKYNLGKIRTPEQIERIRKGHEGQIVSDFARQRSYEVRMQKPYWNLGLTKENDPRIAKMAESRKGQIAWNKGITVNKVSKEDVKEFYLDDHIVGECSEQFKISVWSIRIILKEFGIIRSRRENSILMHKRRKVRNGSL
jgi:group I intron endonuclease